jgi:DNA repair protein RadC
VEKNRMTTMTDSTKTSYRITDFAEQERPRERLRHWGASQLTTAELLAILLRVGVPGENAVEVAQRLIKQYKDLNGLHRAPFDELCSQHGIGEAKAAQIKAALELAYRFKKDTEQEISTINSPEEAAKLVQFDMMALEQEHLRVILLDTRNHVLGIEEVYKGSVNSSQVHVGEIFKAAIRRNASAVIVIHNHPSGDPTPSPDDVAVTRAIIQAGTLLDVDVLDHMVIGGDHWVSLKQRGLAFN